MKHTCKACGKTYDIETMARVHNATPYKFAKCPFCGASNLLPELGEFS